ncbi:MAG: NUDIX domain-containing protein [Kangiellaceae bacterium]
MQFDVLKKESVYDGFFKLNRYHIKNELFEGGWSSEFTREIFERGHAAAILLFDPKLEKLVLVEQFRPGAMESEASPWLMELVAGMIENDEKPENVAIRESLEEAGCEVSRIRKICEYLVSPGGTTERIWLYIGEVDASSLPDYAGLDVENEDIKIHVVDVSLAFDWLNEGRLNNAMTLIALQWFKINWHKGRDIF